MALTCSIFGEALDLEGVVVNNPGDLLETRGEAPEKVRDELVGKGDSVG